MNSVSLPISPNDSELFEHKLVSQANDVDFTHLSHQNTWNWIFKPSVQFVSYFVTLAPYSMVLLLIVAKIETSLNTKKTHYIAAKSSSHSPFAASKRALSRNAAAKRRSSVDHRFPWP